MGKLLSLRVFHCHSGRVCVKLHFHIKMAQDNKLLCSIFFLSLPPSPLHSRCPHQLCKSFLSHAFLKHTGGLLHHSGKSGFGVCLGPSLSCLQHDRFSFLKIKGGEEEWGGETITELGMYHSSTAVSCCPCNKITFSHLSGSILCHQDILLPVLLTHTVGGTISRENSNSHLDIPVIWCYFFKLLV